MLIIRILLLALLFATSSIATAKPKISLWEAAQLAQTYLLKKEIPNDDRYLVSVAWHEDRERPEKSCWVIFWAHNNPNLLDGQLIVRVNDDGTITHEDKWA